MRTLGVDLSAEAEKTAVCEIDWERQCAHILDGEHHDQEIIDRIEGVDVAGIDTPLGWPEAFVNAVSQHATLQDFEGWSAASIIKRQCLRLRETDRFVTREPTSIR